MPRYIDADKLNKKKKYSFQTQGGCFPKSEWFIKADDLFAAPTEDVVEVVRCKDCLFGHRDYDYEYGYTCVKPLYHPGVGEMPHRKLMQDCDYCSHGVRRKD